MVIINNTSLLYYLNNEDVAGLNIFIQKELYTGTEPVVKKITALIDLQARVAQQVYENSKQVNVATSKKLYFLIGASLLFAFVLSAFIVGDTRRLIKNLELSNRKIAASEEKCRAFIENAGDIAQRTVGVIEVAEGDAIFGFAARGEDEDRHL